MDDITVMRPNLAEVVVPKPEPSLQPRPNVWDYFDRVVDEVTKKTKVQCKYCHSTLAITFFRSFLLIN